MARGQYGGGGSTVMDRTAFAQAVAEVLEHHADIASEACWQELSKVIVQYWLVFASDQSPLSTWSMLSKCTETVLKIRAFTKTQAGASGSDALEQFRSFMGEVLGEEPGKG